jgi:hypothetical protein
LGWRGYSGANGGVVRIRGCVGGDALRGS